MGWRDMEDLRDHDADRADGMESVADATYARQLRELDDGEMLGYYRQYIRELGATEQAKFDAWLRREITKDNRE